MHTLVDAECNVVQGAGDGPIGWVVGAVLAVAALCYEVGKDRATQDTENNSPVCHGTPGG